MNLKKLNPTQIAIAVVAVLSLWVISLVIVFNFNSNSSRTGGNNSSSSNTTQTSVGSSQSTSSATIDLGEIDYSSITPEGTIVLIHDDKSTVISLEQRQWKSLQWSPDRANLAVLGVSVSNTDKSIYNVYVYSLNNRSWSQATAYDLEDSAGVSGYAWEGNDGLVFTQGINPDNWLHRLSLSNSVATKLFRVNGSLNLYDTTPYYLTLENINSTTHFNLYAANGVQAFSFTPDKLPVTGLRLVSVSRALQSGKFLIQALNQSEVVSYIWSFNQPEFVPLASKAEYVLPLCARSSDNFLSARVVSNNLQIGVLSLGSGFYRGLAELSLGNSQISLDTLDWDSIVCHTDRVLWSMIDISGINRKLKWYTWEGEQLRELNQLQNHREIQPDDL